MDPATEQTDARAEDHVQVGCCFELGKQLRNGAEGRGEVGVPEAGVLAAGLVNGDGGEHAVADGLGLSAVGPLLEDGDAIGMAEFGGAEVDRSEQVQRAIRAAVIDKEKADGLMQGAGGGKKLKERLGAEAMLLVIEGHDDGAPALACGWIGAHSGLWFHIPALPVEQAR